MPAGFIGGKADRGHIVVVAIRIGALGKINCSTVEGVSDPAGVSCDRKGTWYSHQCVEHDVFQCPDVCAVRSTAMFRRR